jgi:hypothetical protein
MSQQPSAAPAETPLERALGQNEAVKDTVEQSAAELLVINAVLKQEVPPHIQTGEVAQALQKPTSWKPASRNRPKTSRRSTRRWSRKSASAPTSSANSPAPRRPSPRPPASLRPGKPLTGLAGLPRPSRGGHRCVINSSGFLPRIV